MIAATNAVADRLKAQGLQLIDGPEALRLFNDPGREAETIVFIDARDDQHYRAGHIPGAYQFDHYHPEKYLEVVPVCQQAQQVLIYCTGGDCQDSEFAAIDLRQLGVPNEKLYVYAGGWNEWTNKNNAIELETRNSGKLRAAGQ